MQYARDLGHGREGLLGLAYTNVNYDHGRSHAPTVILGGRQYFWKGLHLEYQLWPSYNWYYERDERRYYEGPEVWNEFRPGYMFNFSPFGVPSFVNLQVLAGFALYGGNKPQSFKDQASEESVFVAPMLFLGWRF